MIHHQNQVAVFVLAILAVFSSLALGESNSDRTRPNVIFVLADDLGIGDISATNPNCKIKTPSLQKMADEGITFLDAHSPSAVCTPTRYGVLTGRYNWRSRLAKGVLGGTSEHLIPADRPTGGKVAPQGRLPYADDWQVAPWLGLVENRRGQVEEN